MRIVADVERELEQLNNEIAALMPDDIFADDGSNAGLIAEKQRQADALEEELRELNRKNEYAISETYDVLSRLDKKDRVKIPDNVMAWLKRHADPEVKVDSLKNVSEQAASMISLFYRTYLASAEDRMKYVTKDHKEMCVEYISSGGFAAPEGVSAEDIILKVKNAADHAELERLAAEYGFSEELAGMGDMYAEFEECMKEASGED